MLDYQQTIVKNMSNQIRTSGKTNNEMSALITKLNNSDTRQTVQESTIAADKIREDMNNTAKETMDMNNDVNKLKDRYNELDPEWDSKFGLAEENVAKSLINIREANNTWQINEPILRQQNEKFQAWNDSFSSKLQELRDKIAQAKHAAEGVRENEGYLSSILIFYAILDSSVCRIFWGRLHSFLLPNNHWPFNLQQHCDDHRVELQEQRLAASIPARRRPEVHCFGDDQPKGSPDLEPGS